MKNVYFRKWHYEVPENWNELSGKQLLQITKVLQSEVGDVKGILLLFRALANIPWYQFYLMRTGTLLEAAMECTDFLFDKNTLTKNHLPFYKGFAGPGDMMGNIKMAEFCFSEFMFMQYRHTKKSEDLDKLIAILYRPKKSRLRYNYRLNPDGDFRIAFNPNLLEHHAKKISDWPDHVKKAILLFYEGVRETKIEANPKVFESDNGDQSLYGLWSVMRSVAKGGHFGDFDKVNEQYVDTILMELNETVAEAEKIEMERNRVTVER